jgi:hypothetical protein
LNKRRQHRRPEHSTPSDNEQPIFKRRRTTVKARRRPDGLWELVHPGCALERAEDLEEVEAMIEAGEADVAVEELRWLLEECRDFIAAHYLLGETAFEARDFRLARGHFGYAFELGWSALPEGKLDGPLAYSLPANRPFLQAVKGLAWSLNELGKRTMAKQVLEFLASCDPADPLGAAALMQQWAATPPAE